MISLRHLRLRLTAWYAGSFAAILLLLGVGLFLVLSRERSAELDRSLERVVADVFRAARVRLVEGGEPGAALGLAVEELDGPEWSLYLVPPDGSAALRVRHLPPEIDRLAAQARRDGARHGHFSTPGGQRWRVYAQRFEASGGAEYVVVALADIAPIERHYARLVEVFIAFGLIALLPIALGGYYLARLSAAPAMQRVQRFTADAAHELRTPVAVLRGRAETILERERQAEEYVAALRDVAEESQRLGAIVDDLFLLARADAGERPLAREPVYLDDLATDAVRAAGVLARSRGVRLSMGRYEEAKVRGDPILLRRLLMILLDNAVKFTPSGRSVRLDVYVENHAATLVVEDEGIGISTDDLPQIFDRFFRSDAARTRTEGSGLGLSIARYIADLHDARIGVGSAPGQGSRFTVTFPPADL